MAQAQLADLLQAIRNKPATEIQPPKFSGAESEDFTEWLERFDRCARHNQWNEMKVVSALPLYLTDWALTVYNSLPQETKDNAVLVSQALTTHYDSTERKWRKQDMRFGLRQTDSLDEFINKLNKLTTQLAIQEDVKFRLFINGLKPRLKGALKIRQPRNYEEAVNYARLKDSVQKDDQSVKEMLQTITQQFSGNSKMEDDRKASSMAEEVQKLKQKIQDAENKRNGQVAVVNNNEGFFSQNYAEETYGNLMAIYDEVMHLREENEYLRRNNGVCSGPQHPPPGSDMYPENEEILCAECNAVYDYQNSPAFSTEDRGYSYEQPYPIHSTIHRNWPWNKAKNNENWNRTMSEYPYLRNFRFTRIFSL